MPREYPPADIATNMARTTTEPNAIPVVTGMVAPPGAWSAEVNSPVGLGAASRVSMMTVVTRTANAAPEATAASSARGRVRRVHSARIVRIIAVLLR